MGNGRCVNCFAPLAGGSVCGQCGFDNAAYRPQPHHLPPGAVLRGRYIIGRALGQGGFGITYVGFDTKLDFKVAIKEYFPEGTAMRITSQTAAVSCYPSQSTRERYDVGLRKCVNEARALAKLGAISSVVRVQDFFQENNTVYIVMEFVEGVTLNAYLRRLPERPGYKEAVKLLAPVGAALEEVHERGFVHRDISPDNIMITPKGEPKLLDFGAVKAVATGGNVTETPVIKRGFSPIEMYSTTDKIGPWSDVYAYCATLCCILLGRPPEEPMDRVEEDPLPGMLAKAVSQAQAAALLKGLAFQPSRRCQSMAELLAALTACLNDPAPAGMARDRLDQPEWTALREPIIDAPREDHTMREPVADAPREDHTIRSADDQIPTQFNGKRASVLQTPPQRPIQRGPGVQAQPWGNTKSGEEKEKKKKHFLVIIAAVLVLSIVIGIVVSHQSDELITSTSTTKAQVTGADNNDNSASSYIDVGDYVKFGSYEQDNDESNGKEKIEWLVLSKENGKALLISRYGLDCQPYNTEYNNGDTWETCTLRTWLNDTFYNSAFSNVEQGRIATTTVTTDKESEYSTSPGYNTTDKIFLLSINEAKKYFHSNEARKNKPTAYAKKQGVWTNYAGCCWWWLRSPNSSYFAVYSSHDGSVIKVGISVRDPDVAVRPALWIDLNS